MGLKSLKTQETFCIVSYFVTILHNTQSIIHKLGMLYHQFQNYIFFPVLCMLVNFARFCHRLNCVLSLSKTFNLLLSTGSTLEDPSGHDSKLVDWDVKNQNISCRKCGEVISKPLGRF